MNVNVDAIVSPNCLLMLLCCKTFAHFCFGFGFVDNDDVQYVN